MAPTADARALRRLLLLGAPGNGVAAGRRVGDADPAGLRLRRRRDGHVQDALGVPGGEVLRVRALVSRNRLSFPDASAFTRTVILLGMEPGSLVMERKMLIGIKERAERHAEPPPTAASALKSELRS